MTILTKTLELPGYHFSAFISYCHKDEKWAKWLQKEIEYYRLPVALCRELQFAERKLNPVYRYQTDMTPGQLSENIRSQLNKSKKLIVICSPNTIESGWVDTEIQYFIDEGRYLDIIPFVVDCEPNKTIECFPKALQVGKLEQLAGTNVVGSGRKDALIFIVAGLLGIDFDLIKRRHEQRQRKKRYMLVISILFVTILLSIAGYRIWDFNSEHKSYYADYVLRWGLPEGIFPVTKEQAESMSGHYVITKQFGRVKELSYQNSAGLTIDHTRPEWLDRPTIAVYKTDSDNNIIQVDYLDKNRMMLKLHTYSMGKRVIDFFKDNTSGDPFALGLDVSTFEGTVQNAIAIDKSEIKRQIVDYDENGYIISVKFKRNSENEDAQDMNGIGGFLYENDEFGRVKSITYTDSNLNPIAIKDGVAGKKYTYDENHGDLIKTICVDLSGNPTSNEQGWDICDTTFVNHNLVSESYFDGTGEKTTSWKTGAHSIKYTYNAKGYMEARTFWDCYNPRINHEGYAIENLVYDDFGNCVKNSYFNHNFKPIIIENGYASKSMVYDERRNVIEVRCYGLEDEPIQDSSGVFKYIFIRDNWGNVLQETYYDTHDEMVLSHEGFAKYVAEYDQTSNRLIMLMYFGVSNEPVLVRDGYSVVEYGYDRNKLASASFYGIGGEPINIKSEVSKAMFRYNKNGRLQELSTVKLSGEKVTCLYDENDDQIEKAYYGADGEYVIGDEGYARLIQNYDNNKELIEWATYGVDENLIVIPSKNYAKEIYKFDEHGHLLEHTYYGVDGKYTIGSEGYARFIQKYSNDYLTEWATYGSDDKPIIIPSEMYAKEIFRYDEQGYIAEHSYFGAEGELIIGDGGYARKTFKHNKNGRLIQMEVYGPDNEYIICDDGYTKWIDKYDDNGNWLGWATYGTDGKYIADDSGIARRVLEYSDNGNIIQWTNYGPDGNYVAFSDGVAKRIFQYDGDGNDIGYVDYGQDGKPIVITDITADFVDPAFLAAVRQELQLYFGKPVSEPIFDTDMSALITINLSDKGIQNLSGIEHCTNLEALLAGDNQITFMPSLPSTLLDLECAGNQLSSLTGLPSGLTSLSCDENPGLSLSELPPSLTYLSCSGCELTSLPELPKTLEVIYCDKNSLTELPELPSGLKRLDCQKNQIEKLPLLSPSLEYLECSNNGLTFLPELPMGLERLYCNENGLLELPQLPSGLKYIDCQQNQIKKLSVLPPSLVDLNCSNNFLTFLPEIPCTIVNLNCSSNQIDSLPNFSDLSEDYDSYSTIDLPVLDKTFIVDSTALKSHQKSKLSSLICDNNKLTSIDIRGLSLYILRCNDNYIPDQSAVKGFVGSWDGEYFIFDPQRIPSFIP